MRTKLHFNYLWIALILSCSNSDESPSTKTHFHPPSWIIGVWEETMPNGVSSATYEFTSNNFIDKEWPGANEGLDFNEFINISVSRKIVERISGSTYEIDLYLAGDVPTSLWKFKKISDTEINCILKDGLSSPIEEFNLQKIN